MHYIFFCMGSYMKIKGLCVLAVLLTSSLAGAASNKAASNNPSYGLVDKERHRNRRLFGLHGVGNQNRKNMN